MGLVGRASPSPGDASALKSVPIGFARGLLWLVQYGHAARSRTPIDVDYSAGSKNAQSFEREPLLVTC